MTAMKQQLYERAKYLTEEYRKTHNEDTLIDLAVYAGVYYGTGGRKYIEVPSYHLVTMSVVLILARSKSKFSNVLSRNLKIMDNVIREQMGGVVVLDVEQMRTKHLTISLRRVDTGEVKLVTISKKLTIDDLVAIGLALLELYGFIGLELQDKRDRFVNLLKNLLAYV